jgi:protein-disulfide isomerase
VRAPRDRQASTRVLAVAGGIIAAVVIAVVLVVVFTRGNGGTSLSSIPTRGTLVNALPGAADVQKEFAGIQQTGLFLGSPAAPVRMVEYIDLQCPFCKELETQVMPTIVARFVRTGKVMIEVRTLDFIGPDSTRGRNAMFAAGFQNHAFNFAQLLYDNQQTENTGWLNDAMVQRAAESIPGINPRLLVRQSASTAATNIGKRIDLQRDAAGIVQTPTILVGKVGSVPKEVTMSSPTDLAALIAAINRALS